MRYRITIHPDAEEELKAAHAWLRQQSPEAAERWRTGLLRKATTLARFPERCPLAPEAEKLGEEVTPEWWKLFRARCEEDHRRIEEARRQGLVGNLLLPEKLHDFVTTEVTAGRFGSATDVVSEAVRTCSWHWEHDEPRAEERR